LGIASTYIYFTLDLEMFYYELSAFSLLMLTLDAYHVYWLEKERRITIRKQDTSKLIVISEDQRPSPS
jgi:hypothetical protein